MKYTNNLVWSAVFEFSPALEVAKESGLNVTLPEAIRMAACACFTEIKLGSIASLPGNKGIAAMILQEAMLELQCGGHLEFGTVDEYWQ